MCTKGVCKLASRVLETRVSYKTRVSKTRFLLADLDRFLPHRSRVFYTWFQNTQNKKLQTHKKKKTQKKEERRKPSRKKERRRRSTAKKKIWQGLPTLTHTENQDMLDQRQGVEP